MKNKFYLKQKNKNQIILIDPTLTWARFQHLLGSPAYDFRIFPSLLLTKN